MNTITVIYFFIAILISFLFVYFQYFYKVKKYSSRNLLAVLRFITLLSLFVLLINPKIVRKRFLTVKPELIVAVDNSESIQLNNQDSMVISLTKAILRNKDLNKRFQITTFSFGNSLQNNSKFNFQENKTNINDALAGLNSLYKKQIAPIILISDGNQTYGNDYQYYQSNQPVYPIVVGDTLQPFDLIIDRVNVNSFSYLNNNFPVEVFVHYTGSSDVKSRFVVKYKNKTVFSKRILFSKNKKDERIEFKLSADSIGKHLYNARIVPLKKEKNKINNSKNFAVEVIDEQSNIGLVYNLLHPDIGMLKRSIESNKQRKVHLIDLNALPENQKDMDMYILYQPIYKFRSIFKKITTLKKNYFIIAGTQTDWIFLNDIQNDFRSEITQTTESFFPSYNQNFSTFYLEDIGFSEFPPLENIFGTVKFSAPSQTILLNSVNGIEINSPMLAVYSIRNNRRAALFGENIWKWRSTYYAINKSFVPFDQFINSIIQYLSVHNRKMPVELNYKSFYHANEQIRINAKTYDSNFNFDVNAELELKIRGIDGIFPFVLAGSNYEVIVSNLKSGNYQFIVKDIKNANKISGSFTIGEFSVEQELNVANSKDLKLVAANSNGRIFYPDQKKNLIDLLVQNKKFISTQKEEISNDSLIDWEWLLAFIIVSLSTEWFIRKYRGLA